MSWSHKRARATESTGRTYPPDHDLQVAKLGDIAGEAGLERVSILAWRDLDDPEAGGSEIHASNIAALWAEAGIEVTMRTSYAANRPVVSWRDGYRVIRKAGRYLVFPRAAFSEMMGWHGGRDGLVEIWNGMPFFSPVWARTPNVTWLHHVHAEMWRMTLPPRLAAFGNFVESRFAPPLYRRTSIVTLSESSKQELVDDLRFKSDRVTVVPPGIDPVYSPGGEKSPTPLVVAVGRLVPVKRFDLLVEALVAVKPKHPQLRAVIVGEGYCREALEAQIREARATDWISLPGRIDDAEKIDLYRRAWVLAMTSSREGWGMIVTEAAACGTPAVATRVPGFVDAIVEGETGLLAERRDDTAAAIDTVLRDEPRRALMSARALEARAPVHVGSNGAWHARGARTGRVAAPRQVVTGTTSAQAVDSPSSTRGAAEPTRTNPSRTKAAGYAALAAIAYIPMLFSAPGKVIADTKSYLYLDPSRLLERAPSMWDPSIGLGTVTHQNIGYLLPMGPYYWLTNTLGVPAWVAQRLWFGTVLFAAALGMLFLFRTLHARGPGATAAALVFMLSPYTLAFESRLSVILLPWAGLPWMLGLVIRALRDDRGWKYPAIFAIVVQLVGSVNATALVFVGIVPVLWVFYAVFVTRETAVRRAAVVVGKIALLTLLASLWWIVGLVVQSGYGLDILKYTETLETVSQASLPLEVLRGLGYWFFYGRDKIGQWIEPSVAYTQDLWLLAVTYALPILALLAAAFVRWKHRAFFVIVLLVGVAMGVGAHPYDDPSLVGRAFKEFAASSDFGLALRSTGRAVPLVVLGVAVLLGVGVNAAARAFPRPRRALAGVTLAALVIVLAIAAVPSRWDGTSYGENLDRDEAVPAYWSAAIAAVDAKPHDTRILEIPGSDFASYRWGDTVDPITPGLTDRPYVARELVPWGSPAGADLLNALDRRLQEGVLDPAALAPIARRMSAGDILYRADLQTDRSNLARAKPVWRLLTDPVPEGLAEPERFGESLGPPLRFDQLDELALALPAGADDPPPVSVFPVRDVPPIVRAESATAPLILSGDGEGLVDLAAIGALDGRNVILYSGSFAGDTASLRDEIARDGATLVVTDTNRKRGRRWGVIRDVEGATERVDETALADDEGDARLEVFPDAPSDAFTVVESPGARVSTSRYGNVITYWPEMRGARALDGNVETAWQVGDHAQVIGETLRIDVDEPITTDRVNLVQPLVGNNERFISEITLTFDGEDPITLGLHEPSRTPDGETVTFPRRTFERLELTVADTNVGTEIDYPFSNNVGFAEVRVRDDAPGSEDVRVDEIVRMPVDLVDAAGARAAERPLVYVMNRSRTVVVPPRYSQDEVSMVRELRVPNGRDFGLSGQVRLATAAPDDVLDQALGIPGADAGGVTVTASQHLPASVASRGSSAVDGDPGTAWSTGFGAPVGQWVEVATAQPVTIDRLDLEVVADGRHSVPTQLEITAGGETRVVDVPAIADIEGDNATVGAPVTFAPLTGDTVRVSVREVRETTTIEYQEVQPITMPVALAELGIPGVQRADLPPRFPDTCRTDLLSIDGDPVPVRLDGAPAAAVGGDPIDLAACVTSIALTEGDHVLRSADGTVTGVDVDRVVLGSRAGGDAMAIGEGGRLPDELAADGSSGTPGTGSPGTGTPEVRVVQNGRTKLELEVEGAEPGTPFWLVLGQSRNAGWQATIDGEEAGESTLVDGFANGWLVTPQQSSFAVTLDWTPQRNVWIALGISAAALAVCAVLALWHRRRRAAALDDPTLDGDVTLAPLFGGHEVGVGRAATIASAIIAGVAGAVLVRWWVGVVAAAAVLVMSLRPRLRVVLALGAPIALAVAALYVIVQQYRYDYAPDFFWLVHFDRVQDLAWLAVILVACDALVEIVRLRNRAQAGRQLGQRVDAVEAEASS